MKISVQVAHELKTLHPDARKDIKRALTDLKNGKRRDIRALSNELAGYYRLRVGKYRLIYWRDPSGELIAEFLAPPESVYERFKPQK